MRQPGVVARLVSLASPVHRIFNLSRCRAAFGKAEDDGGLTPAEDENANRRCSAPS